MVWLKVNSPNDLMKCFQFLLLPDCIFRIESTEGMQQCYINSEQIPYRSCNVLCCPNLFQLKVARILRNGLSNLEQAKTNIHCFQPSMHSECKQQALFHSVSLTNVYVQLFNTSTISCIGLPVVFNTCQSLKC